MTDDLDSYHWHEVLDRAHVMSEIFSRVILDHPVIDQNIELKKLAEVIEDKIAELYQTIGRMSPHD